MISTETRLIELEEENDTLKRENKDLLEACKKLMKDLKIESEYNQLQKEK